MWTETLTIRPLTRSDAVDWATLSSKLAAETGVRPDPSEFAALTGEDATNQGAFIAYLGDRPVGYAKINVTQSDHYYERSWEMCAVRVLPRLRAHQVGTHLVRTVHETAVSNGVPAVYWHDAVNQVRPAARNDVLRLTQKVA